MVCERKYLQFQNGQDVQKLLPFNSKNAIHQISTERLSKFGTLKLMNDQKDKQVDH